MSETTDKRFYEMSQSNYLIVADANLSKLASISLISASISSGSLRTPGRTGAGGLYV